MYASYNGCLECGKQNVIMYFKTLVKRLVWAESVVWNYSTSLSNSDQRYGSLYWVRVRTDSDGDVDLWRHTVGLASEDLW